MEKVEITVIGAGVVGLAVASELSCSSSGDILVMEKESSFGRGVSSRNSEVIHAGIYYPKDSLKALTCREGRELLYDFCIRNNIRHRKIGKLIVAITEEEEKDLEALFLQGGENGVEDLRLLSPAEIRKSEPHIAAKAAMYSPSTGILDTHVLMKRLAMNFESNNGQMAYHTELVGIDKLSEGFKVEVKESGGENFEFSTRILINAAGLGSDRIAAMAGLEKEAYKLKYCKGTYFRVHNNKAPFLKGLVYPVPKKSGAGLGIHAILDLGGGLRLGPDDEYVEKIDYDVGVFKKGLFYESARQFLPFLALEDIEPDMAGIRPKLQGPGEGFRDFIIKDEGENGLGGFINLIGIESPGLTCALSIALMVKKMAQRYL